MKRKRGWSLVELLVVAAIIAIIAAIVLSALMTARQSAQQTTCLSNLRQVAQSTLLYLQDHEDQFPIGFQPKRTQNGLKCAIPIWAVLEPYIRSTQIHLCPASRHPTRLAAMQTYRPIGIPPCENAPETVSTQPNWCLFINTMTYPESHPVSMADLPYPSLTGMWFDGWLGSSDMGRFEAYSGVEAWHNAPSAIPTIIRLHERGKYRGKLTAAYVDGHAKSHHAIVDADYYDRGDFIEVIARPVTIEGRLAPRWRIQGGAYHNKESFYGWISRNHPHLPNRFIYRCYPRSAYLCDEWE